MIRGDGTMFVKTKAIYSEKSGVRFVNGLVSLGNVKLNAYCFEIDGVLIDTGAASLLAEFKPFFANADIDKIVLTHHHEDHTGGAAFLQQKFNLPIYMHDMSIAACTEKATYPMYRKFFWGKRQPFQAKPLGTTFTSRQANWEVITTPGHAQDHVAFLNLETNQLFSGDLYVHPKTKVVLRDESIPTIIASIEKILTYDFGEMFCCHAGYVPNGRKAMEKKLQYLTNFQEKVLELHHKGWTIKEIQKEMFPKKYPITYLSLGEWNSIHMIRQVLP